MIETNLLAQFVAFAKAGTLTRAAQDLHTSQPALTRSMKKLEEELEVPLFVRHQTLVLKQPRQLTNAERLRTGNPGQSDKQIHQQEHRYYRHNGKC